VADKLFNETFFKKNNYFRKELNISQDQLKDIQALIKNWQKNCESFNPDVDKETTDENEFVDILFKKILGYSGKGADSDNYNILPKFKIDGASATGKAGYADLALGYFSKNKTDAEVVVEFKGQDSDNLTKLSNRTDKLSPVDQCWKYLVNHTSAKWGIVTNFNEIRIYNKEKGQNVYETFYFNVPEEDKHKFLPLSTETEILKLISILKKENLLTTNGVSKTGELLKNKGVEETKVLKEFYLEYKSLRSQIFYEALKYNTQYETDRPKSELLQLVQKFLDRIIFCWFCEDSREHLIPTNILSGQLIESQLLPKNPYYKKDQFDIYGKVKNLFRAIDEGKDFGIDSGYNGELFKKDKELDALDIPNLIFEEISRIGLKYDFGDENELNVNILGHIFEQSISDLEEMRVSFQELDQNPKKIEKQHVMEFAKDVEVLEHKHTEFDAKKTKRKKEGVFYTPDYITRYMVENTVGVWLDEKFKLVEEKYKNTKRNKEFNIWIEFRDEYLCKIKILDPACGSGAFLIAAFNYLLAKHKEVYEKLKELRKKKESDEAYLLHPDNFDKTILENNLYGVDLNRESVEITKLALWLKTAVRNRKLNNLSDHIKCGNSLIDDKSVAGDLAFDWDKEFSAIMKSGGFDVVVGNPPYVVLSSFKNSEFVYLQKYYTTSYGRLNTFALFLEKISKYLVNNKKHKIGLIIPDSLCLIDYYSDLRKLLLDNHSIDKVIELGDGVFEEAVVPSIIIVLEEKKKNNSINIGFGKDVIKQTVSARIKQAYYYDTPKYSFNLHVDDVFIKLNKLIDDKETFKLKDVIQIKIGVCTGSNEKHIASEPKFKNSKKLLQGKNINRFTLIYDDKFINYDRKALLRAREESIFLLPEKLLMRQTSDKLILSYDNEQYYTIDSLFILYPKHAELNLKYCLCLLNSKLLNRQYQKLNPELGRVFAQVKIDYVNELPIKIISPEDQTPFIRLADIMLSKNKELQEIQKEFTTLLVSELKIEKLTEKLEDWYLLDWSAFSNELGKKKIVLEEEQEVKWLKRFERMKKEAIAIKDIIDSTDKEIDRMVYELYGLTKEERDIVDGAEK
jgi:type I restriction-modification system DNA methylase subunit